MAFRGQCDAWLCLNAIPLDLLFFFASHWIKTNLPHQALLEKGWGRSSPPHPSRVSLTAKRSPNNIVILLMPIGSLFKTTTETHSIRHKEASGTIGYLHVYLQASSDCPSCTKEEQARQNLSEDKLTPQGQRMREPAKSQLD